MIEVTDLKRRIDQASDRLVLDGTTAWLKRRWPVDEAHPKTEEMP